MYSDFYEIPLPALRFEKVEETDTKKWKRHRREKRRSKKKADSLAQQSQETKKRKNDAKTTLKEKQIHSQENDTQSRLKNASKTKALVIREIKLTHRKNGH